MANFCSKQEFVLQSLQNCSSLARQLIALRRAPSQGSAGFAVRREQRAGAAAVPGTDVPCASCALELEKGTTSEQRAAPSASWEWLCLLHTNAAVNAFPESFPEQVACDGAEDLQWGSCLERRG